MSTDIARWRPWLVAGIVGFSVIVPFWYLTTLPSVAPTVLWALFGFLPACAVQQLLLTWDYGALRDQLERTHPDLLRRHGITAEFLVFARWRMQRRVLQDPEVLAVPGVVELRRKISALSYGPLLGVAFAGLVIVVSGR